MHWAAADSISADPIWHVPRRKATVNSLRVFMLYIFCLEAFKSRDPPYGINGMTREKHEGIAIRQYNETHVQLLCPLQYMDSRCKRM